MIGRNGATLFLANQRIRSCTGGSAPLPSDDSRQEIEPDGKHHRYHCQRDHGDTGKAADQRVGKDQHPGGNNRERDGEDHAYAAP